MKRICSLLIILMAMASCGRLPQIYPLNPSQVPELRDACDLPFPIGKWRFVHSVEATMLNRKGVLMGVTVISPDENSVHCVMMTIEGFVLFDAQYDGNLVINRGVPPFDSESFAKGLMDDIRLTLFRPDGAFIGSGTLDSGTQVCRYQNADGGGTDVIPHPPDAPDAAWEIRLYGGNAALKRKVTACPQPQSSENQDTIPGKLEITAYGPLGYALTLELIQAESLGSQKGHPTSYPGM